MILIGASPNHEAIHLGACLWDKNRGKEEKDNQQERTAAVSHNRLRCAREIGNSNFEHANRSAERARVQGLRSPAFRSPISQGPWLPSSVPPCLEVNSS